MKFDQHGCLVREKPRDPGHEIANLGDSCADTCRYIILREKTPISSVKFFVYDTSEYGVVIDLKGFLRHPDLRDVKGWGADDFTNDQLVPLMLAWYLEGHTEPIFKYFNGPFIRGTKKLLQPASWAIIYQNWALLDRLNRFQGWLLGLPFRWSDDETEGKGFRSSKGKVQDYLNMIAIYVFLKRIGKKATLPRPLDECLSAVRLYRQGPKDPEPNVEWEIEVYEKAIKELWPPTV